MSGLDTSSGDRTPCPDDEVLALYVDGNLGDAESAGVDAHVKACAACSRIVELPLGSGSADLLRSALVGRPATDADPVLPEQLGRYQVKGLLGAGAMGTVVEAYDPGLRRTIAIKCVQIPDVVDLARLSERLAAEARALAHHVDPRVVQVFDVGEHHGTIFVVMERVFGRPLRAWAEQASTKEVVAAMTACAQVLGALHERGLVHGDFKPDNVLVEDGGRIRLLDFGLARVLASDAPTEPQSDPTSRGLGSGTPAYMSPELLAGGLSSAAADQYAWCVTLFELLAGRRPFVAKTVLELRRQIDERAIDWPREISAKARRIIGRGLSLAPEERWPSVRDAGRRLRPRSLRLVVVLGGAAVVAAGVAIPTSSATRKDCPLQGATLQPWTPEATASLAQRYGELQIDPTRADDVAERFDQYAERWRSNAEVACQTTSAMPSAMLDCFRDAQAKYGYATRLVGQGEEKTIRRAVLLASRLAPAEQCLRATTRPSELAADAAFTRDRLAEAWVLRNAARKKEAHALAVDAYQRAVSSDRRAVAADAAFIAGLTAPRAGGVAPHQWMLRTYENAAAVGNDRLSADAAMGLIGENVRAAQYDKAEQWVRTAEGFIERTADPLQAARLQSRLSHMYRQRGEPERALTHAKASLEQIGRATGELSGEAAKANIGLGYTLISLGRYAEADEPFRRAIEVASAELGARNEAVGDAYNGRAGAAYFRGELQAAIDYYAAAVSIFDEVFGPDTFAVATLESNMIAALTDLGRHDEALSVATHVLAIMSSTLPPGDLRMVDALVNMGRAQARVGKTDDGLRYLWRAATLFEESGDSSTPQLAIVESNLAEVYDQRGELEVAEKHFLRSQSILTKTYGPDHPDTVEMTKNLARIRTRLNGAMP